MGPLTVNKTKLSSIFKSLVVLITFILSFRLAFLIVEMKPYHRKQLDRVRYLLPADP